MLCMICQKEEATVHVSKIIDNKVNEGHYCITCAKQDTLLEKSIDNLEKNPESSRLPLLRQAVDQFPNDPVALYGFGKALFETENYNEAISTFQKIIQLKPDYTAAYRELGKSLAKAGKIEEAKEIYRKGIEVAQQTGELQTGKEMKVFLKRLEKE